MVWSKSCEAAFLWAKEALPSEQVLVHYDPKKTIVLGVDASPYGIGAVLSHKVDGCENSIEYASRTRGEAEINYAQIEKERLAIESKDSIFISMAGNLSLSLTINL